MQAHAFNVQAIAALFEFRGAIAGANCAQVRKQRTGLRPPLQNSGYLLTKANEGWFDSVAGAGLQFLARVGNRVRGPVNVLRGKAGRVGLRCSGVPEQLVEVATLGVAFAL